MSKEEDIEYKVVYNQERQYSIWPTWKVDPPGWESDGTVGTKQQCLDHIEKVWTDMRPLSLQNFMKENGLDGPREIKIPPLPQDNIDHFRRPQPPNELVMKLMEEQDVVIIRYKEGDVPNLEKLMRAIEIGYILVKFIHTQGGTELGANIKKSEYNCFAELIESENIIKIRGFLKLDYTPVILNATISLLNFEGKGHLELIDVK